MLGTTGGGQDGSSWYFWQKIAATASAFYTELGTSIVKDGIFVKPSAQTDVYAAGRFGHDEAKYAVPSPLAADLTGLISSPAPLSSQTTIDGSRPQTTQIVKLQNAQLMTGNKQLKKKEMQNKQEKANRIISEAIAKAKARGEQNIPRV
eukprot:g46809.t1